MFEIAAAAVGGAVLGGIRLVVDVVWERSMEIPLNVFLVVIHGAAQGGLDEASVEAWVAPYVVVSAGVPEPGRSTALWRDALADVLFQLCRPDGERRGHSLVDAARLEQRIPLLAPDLLVFGIGLIPGVVLLDGHVGGCFSKAVLVSGLGRLEQRRRLRADGDVDEGRL